MSKETAEWLNTMTLIGFTEKRGEAWHYQESLQGDEPNHYVGPVPVEDIERRLFNFEVESEPVFVKREVESDPVELFVFEDGEYRAVPPKAYVPATSFSAIPRRKAWSANDNGDVLGIFTDNYRGHQYKQWLVENVSTILDDGLAPGSAGLLKNRGQAWVSVEVPENIETPEGVVFRPNLVAATSFDGSMSTTYARTITLPVCDNTLAAGLAEDGQKFRLRHTTNSLSKITNAREALGIVYEAADVFAAEVEMLCATPISSDQWKTIVNKMVPLDGKEGRGLTIAENKQGKLQNLYSHDIRVAKWNGTAFGVLQAFNTYEHHYAGVKGQSVVQRNRSAALSGSIMSKDAEVLKLVDALVAA